MIEGNCINCGAPALKGNKRCAHCRKTEWQINVVFFLLPALVASVLLLAGFLCSAATPQVVAPPPTALTITAFWDDGTPVASRVVLTQLKPQAAPAISYALTQGVAKVTRALDQDVVYVVRVMTQNLTTAQFTDYLYQFPFSTTMVPVGSFRKAQIDLKFRKADRSVVSANVCVSLEFLQ